MSEQEREYRGTSYLIDAPGAPLAIRIDERSAELDELLARFNARTWAFITAYNPYSEPRSPEENLARHRRLLDAIRARGLQSFPSAGIDDDGTAQTERGLLVVGIERDDAVALGRELEQNAIVVGSAGAPAELVVCVGEGDRP